MSEMDKKISDASPPSEGVKVKPLEWVEHIGDHADSIIGNYHVRYDGDEPDEWSWSRSGGAHHYFPSREEAKAAAQADYEQRIRSALEPTPEHVEGDVLSVGEMEVVAWMHPTAGWARTKYHSILSHCLKPGPGPVALVTLSSAQSSIQRAERERDEAVEYASTSSTSKLEAANNALLGRVASLEAQLADAVKVLEEARDFANSFHITVVDNFYKDVALHLDSPHALSLRLQNDSSKSWIFADLEARRKAVLTTIGEKPDAE